MDPTQTMIKMIQDDPLAMRRAFTDERVLSALKAIGVGSAIPIGVSALHAPGPTARTETGQGVTLCGEGRSVRHPVVTCKHCLRMRAKQ